MLVEQMARLHMLWDICSWMTYQHGVSALIHQVPNM